MDETPKDNLKPNQDITLIQIYDIKLCIECRIIILPLLILYAILYYKELIMLEHIYQVYFNNNTVSCNIFIYINKSYGIICSY